MQHFELLLFAALTSGALHDKPLPPSWSPDHQILATTNVPQRFVTPEGGNYQVLLNGKAVYPQKTKHFFADFYAGWHTLLSDFAWSPDSADVAFVEKTYDWQYSEPFNQYFDGRVSNEHFYLTILSREGKPVTYGLDSAPEAVHLEWLSPLEVSLNGRTYQLSGQPPPAKSK